MHSDYKHRRDPPEPLTETLLHHVDTRRQLYNHVLYKLTEADEIPARYKTQGTLPADTDSVSGKRVMETGSPTLKQRPASPVSEQDSPQYPAATVSPA